jgi:hypothetical protein
MFEIFYYLLFSFFYSFYYQCRFPIVETIIFYNSEHIVAKRKPIDMHLFGHGCCGFMAGFMDGFISIFLARLFPLIGYRKFPAAYSVCIGGNR